MGKLVLCIIDEDMRFLESIARYLRSSAHGNDFTLKGFTGLEGLAEHIRTRGQTDLILAKPTYLRETEMPAAAAAVELTGDACDDAHSSEGVLRVSKYQPLDQMFASLAAIAEERMGGGNREQAGGRKSGMKVLSVFSATGGCGKSTVAANLAKMYAFRDRRAFYLNLERLQSPPFFGLNTAAGSEKQAFSKWMYYVQSGERQLSAKLTGLASKDPEWRVGFFEPVSDMEEMEQIGFADARRLIDAMHASGQCDELIVDLDAGASERALGAISASDEVVWIFTDDILSLTKTERLLERLNGKLKQRGEFAMPHITFAMNKFTGTPVHNPPDFGIRSHVRLPYIPAWKSVRHTGQLLGEAVFQEQLLSVLIRREPGRGNGGGGTLL